MRTSRRSFQLIPMCAVVFLGAATVTAAPSDGVQLNGDRTFAPAQVRCNSTIAEAQANHPELGQPVQAQDQALPDGGRFRDYPAGSIYLNPRYGCAFAVRWGFSEQWKSEGQQLGLHGYPVSDETSSEPGRSRQYFDKGSMWWSQVGGVVELHGEIAVKHLLLGAAAGYPLTSQTQTLDRRGQRVTLDNNTLILWSPVSGAWTVRNGILAHYQFLRAEQGYLGYPLTDEICTAGQCGTAFQWGRIAWSLDRGVWTQLTSWTGDDEYVTVFNSDIGVFAPSAAALVTCSKTIQEHEWKHPELGQRRQAEEQLLPDGGRFRDYEAGAIVLHPRYGCAFAVRYGFWDRWNRAGRQAGAGYPVSDELSSETGRARQYFSNSSMWWTPATGVRLLASKLGRFHFLLQRRGGYPSTDPALTPDGRGEFVHLENNTTVYGLDNGGLPSEVHGPIQQLYMSLSAERGRLGLPTRSVECNDTYCESMFVGGYIRWTFGSNPVATFYAPPPSGPTTGMASVPLTQSVPYSGYIVFKGSFPPFPIPAGHLLSIKNPGAPGTAWFRILKSGLDGASCTNASSYVELSSGATTSSAQIMTLYGSVEPPFPVTVTACVAFTSGPIPQIVSALVTYRY